MPEHAAKPRTPRTLYLIDGHAHFFRAYHAIRTRMSSPVTGEPTQMTYGFVSMLVRLLRDYRPQYVAVAIDGVPVRVHAVRGVVGAFLERRDVAPCVDAEQHLRRAYAT